MAGADPSTGRARHSRFIAFTSVEDGGTAMITRPSAGVTGLQTSLTGAVPRPGARLPRKISVGGIKEDAKSVTYEVILNTMENWRWLKL